MDPKTATIIKLFIGVLYLDLLLLHSSAVRNGDKTYYSQQRFATESPHVVRLSRYKSGFSFQQRVLCDFTSSISGLESLSDGAWDCSTSVSNATLCHHWYGVSCSANNESITAIELNSLLLSGSIPPSIGNLTALQTLSLAENLLTGSIPTTIGKLTALETFNVYINYMDGRIPESLFNCTALQILILDANSFSGSIPSRIGELSELTYIDFGTNLLTGTLPSSLGNLNRVSLLSLYTNSMTGTFPSTIGKMSSLSWLGLDTNHFSGTLPSSMGDLSALNTVTFYGESIKGTLPSSFGKLTNLQAIYGFQSSLTGTIPASWGNMEKMSDFLLYENKLNGTLPSSLSKLRSMGNFDVSGNSFWGTIPTFFQGFSNMSYLILRENKFTGAIPSFLSKLSAVKSIDLGGNSLAGTIPSTLSGFSSLYQLLLYDNFLNGSLPASFGDLTTVERLYLYGNKLTGELPSTLSKLVNLIDVNINHNRFIGAMPSFSTAVNLSSLDVSYNNFTGSIPTTLCSLGNLATLSVVGNDFNCFPVCLPLTNSDALTSLSHCASTQDTAFCDFIDSTNVYSAVISKVSYSSLSYESSHPYLPNTVIRTLISSPGAAQYTITFDSRTTTFIGFDIVYFCSAPTCLSSEIYGSTTGYSGASSNFPGQGAIPALTIAASEFYVAFTVVSSTPYWGFKFTALGETSPGSGWNCTTDGYATGLCDGVVWSGCTCTGGKVTYLDLSGYNIKGSLPSSLGGISQLLHLDLHYNNLKGTVPTSIGAMSMLQYFDLSGNSLTGKIPASTGNLSSALQVLLGHNSFTGTVPHSLSKLSSLLQLDLSSTSLHGVLPSELCSISAAAIDISGNTQMTCYESDCWFNKTSSDPTKGVSNNFGTIGYCAPSSMPTSMPTQPTGRPTGAPTRRSVYISNSNNNGFSTTSSIILGVVLGVSGLVCIIVGVVMYLRRRAKREQKLAVARARKTILETLPIHKAIEDNIRGNELLQIVEENIVTAKSLDYEGLAAFALALEHKVEDVEVLLALLSNSLPVDPVLEEPVPEEEHQYAWIQAVQSDAYQMVVQLILDKNPTIVLMLAAATDSHGRQAVNIASPRCKRVIQLSTYFLRRYEILTLAQPHHQSATCVLHLAIDHEDNGRRVALKFMKKKGQFLREIGSRSEGFFDETYVVNIIRVHGEVDNDIAEMRTELARKGLGNYPYCIVMQAGDRSLADILTKEHLKRDWERIRTISLSIARCVEHVLSKGFIHGDLKPLNIIRVGDDMKLIDFDASANYLTGNEFSATKYSTGYLPPELLLRFGDVTLVRSMEQMHKSGILYDADIEPLQAAPAHDLWSLGVVIFHLCASAPLFLCDNEDNLRDSDLATLADWPDDVKMRELKRVKNSYARNLISQLLNKDPAKRPSIQHVLNHPFLTGKTATRLSGEAAEFDVFLSYRVDSDLQHAEVLYSLLTAAGVRVWWDRACLQPGEPWEVGFCKGLAKSRTFIPLLSRGGIHNPSNPRQDFSRMCADSAVDNVFLEHRLALELRDMGLIEKIFPVFIGPTDEGDIEVLSRYSFAGDDACHPRCSRVAVDAVEVRIRQVLEQLGLGLPLNEAMPVSDVVGAVVGYQGFFVEGIVASSMKNAVEKIGTMLDNKEVASPSSLKKAGRARFGAGLESPRSILLQDSPKKPNTRYSFPGGAHTSLLGGSIAPLLLPQPPSVQKKELMSKKVLAARDVRKARVVRKGQEGRPVKVSIVSLGVGMEPIEAAKEIEHNHPHVSVTVVEAFSARLLEKELILALANSSDVLVSVEEQILPDDTAEEDHATIEDITDELEGELASSVLHFLTRERVLSKLRLKVGSVLTVEYEGIVGLAGGAPSRGRAKLLSRIVSEVEALI